MSARYFWLLAAICVIGTANLWSKTGVNSRELYQNYIEEKNASQKEKLLDDAFNTIKNEPEEKFRILKNLCYLALNSGAYEDASSLIDRHIKESLIHKDTFNLCRAHSNQGVLNDYRGNYTPALKCLFKALRLAEAIHNEKLMSDIYSNIGIVYDNTHDSKKALEYYHKDLALIEHSDDTMGISGVLHNLSGQYCTLQLYDSAMNYVKRAYHLNRLIKNFEWQCLNLQLIGNIYQNTNQLDSAEIFYLQSAALSDSIGEKYALLISDLALGQLYIEQGKYDKAQAFLNKANELAIEAEALDYLKEIEETYSRLYEKVGRFADAFQHYKLYIKYRDSIYNEENSKAQLETRIQYEFDKKEAIAQAEQHEKDLLAEKELQRQRLIRNVSLSGACVLMLFLLVVVLQRNRIKKGKKRSDELLLNILPEEVADELKKNGNSDAKLFDEVTVLFTDFKNFTQWSETLSPAELVNIINEFFTAFDRIIDEYKIEKIKTIGDAYMAAGGLPTKNKTHAYDVVKAALDLRDFIKLKREEGAQQGKMIPEIRIGIHTGPVVAGIVGLKKFQYDIWGDTVNTASRMESSSEAGKINISASTYQIVKNRFVCENRGKLEVKGKGLIDMYFVVGVLPENE
ncbi:MAG: tetratricopeptide repeat protein [Bacteroidetes bacterium]|nr:tetratricopeptide repeat protein [Bacteroidota bacterium]